MEKNDITLNISSNRNIIRLKCLGIPVDQISILKGFIAQALIESGFKVNEK